MAVPVEQLSIKSTTGGGTVALGSTKAALGDRLGQIINVKTDFGAVGDGSTNDTTAIQAAFDAAFGSISSPGLGVDGGNSPVFFPKGVYIVNSPSPITVTGAGAGAGGRIQLTVTSTSTLLTGYTVLVNGVLGTTEANGVWGITVDDASHITLYNASGRVFANAWSAGAGQTVRTSALHLRAVRGGHIFGVNRFSSMIKNNASSGILISTNACDYATFEGLTLSHNGTTSLSVCFELFSDGNQTGVACQGNTFRDIYFENGDYGLRIAGLNNDGQMGSESCLIDCHFQNNTSVGLYMGSYNALQTTMLGGQAQNCGRGIYDKFGTTNTILGTAFQANTIDIHKENSGGTGGDASFISGCRVESTGTFLRMDAPQLSATVSGVTVTPLTGGTFLNVAGHVIVENCNVHAHTITSSVNSYIDMRGCCFSNYSFLSGVSGSIKIADTRVGAPHVSTVNKHIGRYRSGRTYDIEATALSDASVIYDGGSSDTVTISNATPAVVTTGGTHYLAANVAVVFTTTGALPSPLVASQTYYVKSPSGSTFNVSSTAGGAAINTTTSGSGTHTIQIVRMWAVGDQILKSNVVAGGSPGWICNTAGPALTDGTSVAAFRTLGVVS